MQATRKGVVFMEADMAAAPWRETAQRGLVIQLGVDELQSSL
jgi:hypothetical protein